MSEPASRPRSRCTTSGCGSTASSRSAPAPARRLLSDFLRHDLRLTGTHVGCEHGVCGACTVLVDGAPMRSCLMFAVVGPGARDHHRRGARQRPPGALSPVQQAFAECHGLQCGFCTPGFLTTITAYLEDNPRPDARGGARGDLGQPVPLHRLPEHRQGGAAGRRDHGARRAVQLVEPARRLRRRSRPDDAPGCSARRSSAGRTPACSPATAATSTTSATTRSPRRSCAARTPTPASSTSTSTDALDVDGVVAIYTWEDLARPGRPSRCRCSSRTRRSPTRRTGYAWPRTRSTTSARPVVMVVARDRYVAEDACPAHPGRPTSSCRRSSASRRAGRRRARARRRARQRRRPPAAGGRRRRGRDRRRAAHRSTLELDDRAQRLHADGGQGRLRPLGPTSEGALRLYSSTQTSTGVRAAVAAKLELPLAKVECIAPDVGGGFGVKIVHPWPEEVLVPWAARLLGRRREVDRGPSRALHLRAHERGQLQDGHGRLRRRRHGCSRSTCKFWHDNGAYTPYGIIVPIITSTQLLGPYKPGAYRVEFWSLYTNTVIVTPYRGAGRPQGCFAMERTMDAIADAARPRPHRGAVAQLHPARRDAVRPRADLPGRPTADVRLRRLPGDPGQAQGARRLGRLRGLPRGGRGRGPPGRHRHRLLRRGHRRRALRGRPRPGRDERPGQRRHRPHDAGPGPRDRASRRSSRDELGVPLEDVHVTTGDTRRMAVRRRHVRVARRRDERQRDRARGAQRCAPRRCASPPTRSRSSPDDLEIVDGIGARSRGHPATSMSLVDGAVLSNPLRYAFDEAAPGRDPVRRHLRPRQAAGRRGRRARPRGHGLLLPHPVDVRQRHARGDRRDRPGDRRDPHPALLRRARLRHDDQPDDRRGPGARRRRPGRRRRALRADGLRRVGPAAQRVVHGLPHALRHRGAARSRSTTSRRRRPLNPLGIKGAGEAGVHPGVAPSSPRRSRTPRASGSLACRSHRTTSGSCAAGTPPARSRHCTA